MKLLSMSGYIPEQICDTVRFTQYTGNRNIPHYCGYISDFITQVLEDDSIDGAVFPHTCDSSRIMKSYMSGSDKFLYQLNVPVRSDESAVGFFAESIKDYKRSVERHYGISITDEDVVGRSELVNRRDAGIKAVYDDLESVSYTDYLETIHRMLQNPLSEQSLSVKSGVGSCSGKRAFVVGSFLSNTDIARKIESYGFNVVGDNLPESGRLALRKQVPLTGDIYREIAASIVNNRLSPTQNDFGKLLSQDLAEIKSKGVQAVIFISQKYCEPYDYLYSVYKKKLDDVGVPSLRISITNSEDSQKSELLLETFADIL